MINITRSVLYGTIAGTTLLEFILRADIRNAVKIFALGNLVKNYEQS